VREWEGKAARSEEEHAIFEGVDKERVPADLKNPRFVLNTRD